MNTRKVVTIAAVVVVAGAGGWLVQRQMQPAPTITAAEPVAAAPAAAAATAEASASTEGGADKVLGAAPRKPLPEILPDFKLADRDGKLRQLSDWAGRPLVVNYWATWCPPCVREIPLLSKLRKDRAGMKLEVVGIAVDFREDVLAFAKREKLDYPLLIGEEDGLAAVDAVGMTPAFPFTLFTDSKHRVIALKVGELHQPELDLILNTVQQVDAGSLSPADARTRISEGLKTLAVDKATGTPAA